MMAPMQTMTIAPPPPMGAPSMIPGRQMPGMGYDTYLREEIARKRRRMQPISMPPPPPRFPSPGRMDGSRVYPGPVTVTRIP